MDHDVKTEIQAVKDHQGILAEANATVHAGLGELEQCFHNLEVHFHERLLQLEKYLPILGEHFSGLIAGADDTAAKIVSGEIKPPAPE